MAAGRHLGFYVFTNISETNGRGTKQMKIWARRAKVDLSFLWVQMSGLKTSTFYS